MEILSVRNEAERKQMLNLCSNLWEKHALIPVIGAGFSFDTPTDNDGAIPSVSKLREELYTYISKYSQYDPEEIEELEKLNLSELASSFWDIFERIPEDQVGNFYEYISKNFKNISFFKNFQKEFLKIRWPYLFTLNYDSLIEDYGKQYYAVIPFDKINKFYAQDKTKVFKLHGDANRYLSTADPKYLILSRDQYVQSMMSEDNKDMLEELLTAFSSKSILFFGCGLSEELDLLYTSQTTLSEKTKSIDPKHQSIIYINFETDDSIGRPLTQRKRDLLSRYGITTVFRFSSEDETYAFFKELAEKTSDKPQNDIEVFLESYSSMQHSVLNSKDIRSRDFLFQENLIWDSFKNHQVTLPSFYIERSKLSGPIDYISDNNPLCFVSGNFFSGKTFFLVNIAHHFAKKKVYIFPSGTRLTEQQLSALLEKGNALFCFDSKSLTTAQIKIISQDVNLQKMKAKKSSAVVAIDKSDAPMYKYIFEARNVDKEFKVFPVSGKFNDEECEEFNDKIGVISLPPMLNKETILDYVVHNETKLLGATDYVEHFLKPEKELLATDSRKRVRALIMLATEIRIPAKRAIQFKIDKAINDIIALCKQEGKSSVIERDYSVYNGDSSGFEYVCNSKYWAIRALSSYAKEQKDSIQVIAKAYLDIIEVYRSLYRSDDVLFYQSCEPYYFFDHIQVLFNQRWFPNSSKLMNAIYDELMQQLSNSYQFLHQKAKGKLIIAQVQVKSKRYIPAKKTLKDAVYNITRAQTLAGQYPNAKNIEETLLHMAYTAGRIYIEYSCISLGYTPQAVDACYKLYQMQNNSRHDIYDFVKSAGDDLRAFNRFKYNLTFNSKVKAMNDLDEKKAEFLLSRWLGKSIRYKVKA